MRINLNPTGEPYGQPFEAPLEIARSGEKLSINGLELDFGAIPAGATLPDGAAATGCPHIVGPIERDGSGVLRITLWLPHAADAPDEARFPAPIIDPPDGPVALPQTNWPPVPPQTEQGGDDASN